MEVRFPAIGGIKLFSILATKKDPVEKQFHETGTETPLAAPCSYPSMLILQCLSFNAYPSILRILLSANETTREKIETMRKSGDS